MAKLTEELYAALTTLNKAVFSQPAERDAPTRQTLRPILLKGERYYQLESFRDNKAFHQNFTEEQAADYARENLEGRYRQALIVTQTESRQYILRRDGSYKRTASAAALPRPGGEQAHNREKDYILREGEAMLADTDIWLCTACGFVYVGDAPPEMCPVCKVPSWKFEKIEGRVTA